MNKGVLLSAFLIFFLSEPAVSYARQTVALDFASLPSSQGWTYLPNCGSSCPTEAEVFSVNGSQLRMDTMGLLAAPQYRWPTALPHVPFELQFRARVTEHDNNVDYLFTAFVGVEDFFLYLGLGPGKVTIEENLATESVVIVNTSVFHDYRLLGDPGAGTYRLFIDGVEVLSKTIGHKPINQSLFGFGDRFISSDDSPVGAVAELTVFRLTQSSPSPECAYPFATGSGESFVQYCLSPSGTISRLQSPAAQEHLAVGRVSEGYVICTGSAIHAYDISSAADGFGAPVVTSGPTGTSMSIRRSSADFQLDQKFVFDKSEKDFKITMSLTNISSAPIPNIHVTRAYDPDINNGFGDDFEIVSRRGVWAIDKDGVALTGITWNTPVSAAVDTGSSPACPPVSATASSTTGDDSLATVTYDIGTLLPGKKKTVVFLYRAQ